MGLLLWYLAEERSAQRKMEAVVGVLRVSSKTGKRKQRDFVNTASLLQTKDFLPGDLGALPISTIKGERLTINLTFTSRTLDAFDMCLRCCRVAVRFCRK